MLPLEGIQVLELTEAFSQKTREEWQQLFRQARLRCDPCLTYAELFAHPQVEANEIVTTIEHPVQGEIRMPDVPVRLSKTPGYPQCPPPILGQHSKEILIKLGYTQQQIDELITKGILKATSLDHSNNSS